MAVDLAGLLDLEDVLGAVKGVEGKVKAVEPENVHLTMKFLGDTPRHLIEDIISVMRDSVRDIDPFEMTLRGVGAFPNSRKVRVIWIGCEGAEALTKVAKGLDDGCSRLGFKREGRSFSAHLTVGRVKWTKDRRGLAALFDDFKDRDFGTVQIDRIRLKRSVLGPKGPTYSTVEDVSFEE